MHSGLASWTLANENVLTPKNPAYITLSQSISQIVIPNEPNERSRITAEMLAEVSNNTSMKLTQGKLHKL